MLYGHVRGLGTIYFYQHPRHVLESGRLEFRLIAKVNLLVREAAWHCAKGDWLLIDTVQGSRPVSITYVQCGARQMTLSMPQSLYLHVESIFISTYLIR